MRTLLEKEISERGLNEMHGRTCRVDPTAVQKYIPTTLCAAVRALEIYRLTGKNASCGMRIRKIDSQYDIFYIGLIRGRSTLYKNIENRVKVQFASGYPEEVEWLLKQGYSPKSAFNAGIWLQGACGIFKGKCTFEEALMGDIRSTKGFFTQTNDLVQAFCTCNMV